MKKFTQMFLVPALCLLGAMNVMAADQKVELESEMFKSWSSPGIDAVPSEETAIADDADFSCTYALYTEVGPGDIVFGHSNVYYLWYANLTGTKKFYFEGTSGVALRVLMNRAEPVEGGDSHGGDYVERTVTIGSDGTAELDVSDMEYVHVNAIKLTWGSARGTLKKIEVYGSVKPVSGWVDLLNNGDLEGTSLESFPVSKDGPNNGETANDRPVIAEWQGEKAMKVTSDQLTPASNGSFVTWSTQFFLKFSEAISSGSQWKLEFDAAAGETATITTSAQGEPRQWHAAFVDAFEVGTAWNHFEYDGTVTDDMAGTDGFASVAFDLNNSKDAIDFYFKNVHFYTYKEKSPMSQIQANFSYDVVCVDFGTGVNMKTLVGSKKRIIYPNDCVTVTVNGNATTLLSVEGRPDGKLYIFVNEGYSDSEDDVVEVSFTNPQDPALHLVYEVGKWEGLDVPDFTKMVAGYQFELGENYSYLAEIPSLESADPEDGSFNLPVDKKEFKLVFDALVDCSQVVAKLDNEPLTVAPADGFSQEITLTRTATADLTAGEHTIFVTKIFPYSQFLGEDAYGEVTLTLSFGKVEYDPNDQPMDLVSASYFEDDAEGHIPVGYKVVCDEGVEVRTSENNYTSGPRLFAFGQGGDFTRALYTRNGYISYGELDGYKLTMETGKKYTIHFNTARWKTSGEWFKFQVIDEFTDVELEAIVQNNPSVDGTKGDSKVVTGSTVFEQKFSPAMDGEFILKWYVCDKDGNEINSGYTEPLLANVWVKYVPSSMGVEETLLLETAMENAKAVRDGNLDERFAGEDFSALVAAIEKYEAEAPAYTAPSAYRAAAAELDRLAQAMKDHRLLCDTYDPLPAKGQDILDANAEKKFARTSFYTDLKNIVGKYATKKTETQFDDELNEVEVVVLDVQKLTDNGQLQTAINELNVAINNATAMFTEGASKCNMTGYAVLTERLRLGAATLKKLGHADDDALVVAANNALSDNDNLAETIKKHITLDLYTSLKDGADGLFGEKTDENTLETYQETYDMTVFVKNPNVYKLMASTTDLSQENIPGWNVSGGTITTGWSEVATDIIPGDAMVSTWASSTSISQTITDLPAGVYTLYAGFGERSSDEAANEGSYLYVKTSANVEDSVTVDVDFIGQSYPVDNTSISNIVVTDGQLTIGARGGSQSHIFFNEVQLVMTNAASGFDYTKGYEEAVEGVGDAKAQTATVRGIMLFDMNGRRIATARPGICIVKKFMSDGTIVTEKVVRK